MATTTSGSITFKQVTNGEIIYASMHIPKAISLSALIVFAHALAPYTDAAIIAVSFSTEQTIEDLPSTGSEVLGFRAGLLFHGAAPKSQNFAVPAPKETIFEMLSDGLRVKESSGGAIAAAYSTLISESFEFIRGRLS